jgi:hypothetical protein
MGIRAPSMTEEGTPVGGRYALVLPLSRPLELRGGLASACEGTRWLDVALFRDRGAVDRRRR